MEVRLWRQQRQRLGGEAPRGRRLRRARADLRPLLLLRRRRRLLGELLDPRLQRGRELGGRRRLLAQEPQGPVGVLVEGVGRGGRGAQREGEREGGAGQRGVGGHAAVQQLGQLQPLQDGLADGEALGVALQDGRRLLGAAGSSVRVSQLLLAPLPIKWRAGRTYTGASERLMLFKEEMKV